MQYLASKGLRGRSKERPAANEAITRQPIAECKSLKSEKVNAALCRMAI